MVDILLIIFSLSLILISISNRLLGFIKILALQGIILFIVSFIELQEISTLNLIFILMETIVFKTLAVPLFLNYAIKKNKTTTESEPYIPKFLSLIIVTSIIIGTFLLSNAITDPHLSKIYFVTALSALFTGLYIIISRKKVLTHVMGFLVIENGVFALSLAVGTEMPNLVNTGVLLDLFVSILLLGIFANKIGTIYKDVNAELLRELKD